MVWRSLCFWEQGMEKQLVQRFKNTFDSIPKWAWQFPPTIPLVGQQYKPGKGLLIYASAENLSWLHNSDIPARFSGKETAWNRYRIRYEETGKRSGSFFPDIGIQPATDGGLFVAGLFVSQKNNLPVQAKPRTFLEHIAISNWCKFSIRSTTNRDYINDVKKLTESLPFVVGELTVLRPKVALVPLAIWKRPLLQAAMRGASPETLFLPVPQFNATVVNIHLKRYGRPAATLKRQHRNTPLALWMDSLSRFNKSHAWRYLAML
jgi:hypothetical protein